MSRVFKRTMLALITGLCFMIGTEVYDHNIFISLFFFFLGYIGMDIYADFKNRNYEE